MKGAIQPPLPVTPGDGNVTMRGEVCRHCDRPDVMAFVSPACGASHFCGSCGVVSLGTGFYPSRMPALTGHGRHPDSPGHWGNPGPCPVCAATAHVQEGR